MSLREAMFYGDEAISRKECFIMRLLRAPALRTIILIVPSKLVQNRSIRFCAAVRFALLAMTRNIACIISIEFYKLSICQKNQTNLSFSSMDHLIYSVHITLCQI